MKIKFEQLIDDSYKIREKKQEDVLSNALRYLGIDTNMTKAKNTLKGRLNDYHDIRELKQEKILLKETIQLQKIICKKINKKFQYIIGFLLVFVAIILFTAVFNFEDHDQNVLRSNYLIQNLRGDTIDTWTAWKITQGDTFHVNVVDSIYATEERLDAISDVILSTEKLDIDDSLLHKGPAGEASTYYTGWMGALNSIDKNTELTIPKNLHFDVTRNGEGNILIELTTLSNPDGFSAFTTAITDEEQHQILKSRITIYNIESLSIEQLKTILRHELGHGFGLAHSSAPEDLMASTITTNFPYISDCDLDAIELLYDGGQSSQVICEK